MTVNRFGHSPLPAEIRDGVPHLTYYVAPLSFVWNGTIGDPIHVQHGGYGEPTTALIPTPPGPQIPPITSPHRALTWFRVICDTWFHEWEAGHREHPYADDLIRAFERIDGPAAAVEHTGGNCRAVAISSGQAEALVTNGDAALPAYDDPMGGVLVTASRLEEDDHLERWLPGPPAADVVAAVALHLLEQVLDR